MENDAFLSRSRDEFFSSVENVVLEGFEIVPSFPMNDLRII